MYITFNSVKLHNFFSFEDSEVVLSNNGFVLVEGLNKNLSDNAESNGSGKSSMFEAISWVLTGETIRGSKDIKRRGDNDGCYVEIDFDIDKDNYRILRSKEHKEYKTNLFIWKNGENKSGKGIRDTSELLKQYLPDVTPSLINSVILLGQGLPMRFTNNTPAGRKEVLEKLSKSDFMIEDLKSRIDERAKELSKEVSSLEKEETECKTAIQILSGQIDADKIRIENMGSVKDYEDAKSRNEKQKKILEDSLSGLRESLNKKKDSADSSREKYERNNSALISLLEENSKELESIKQECVTSITNNESGLSQLTNKAYALEQEIRSLESVTDVCPTCGQKLPNVHKIDTTDKRKELSKLNSEINQIKEQSARIKEDYVKKYNDKSSAQDKNTYTLKQEIAKENKNYNSMLESYNTTSSQVAEIEREIIRLTNAISYEESAIRNYNDTIKQLEEEIKNNTEKANEYSERLNGVVEKSHSLTLHSEVISKFNTAVKRDFRGYLLSGVINYIDKKAKEYCEQVFETKNISFELNGNNIDISYNDKQYESLSGGERQRIDLIVQLSLRDMLCEYLNFSCNILVLDEITDNLDKKGCEKILSLITNELTDIESVYIISHRPDLEIPYDKQLVVEKGEDGISRVA